jgi:streptomycin 6-kinase
LTPRGLDLTRILQPAQHTAATSSILAHQKTGSRSK